MIRRRIIKKEDGIFKLITLSGKYLEAICFSDSVESALAILEWMNSNYKIRFDPENGTKLFSPDRPNEMIVPGNIIIEIAEKDFRILTPNVLAEMKDPLTLIECSQKSRVFTGEKAIGFVKIGSAPLMGEILDVKEKDGKLFFLIHEQEGTRRKILCRYIIPIS